MATLLKQGRLYYIQFFDRTRVPQRKRHSLKVTTLRAAEKLKATLEDDAALGVFDPWVDDPLTYKQPVLAKGAPKTFKDAIDAICAQKEREKKSDATVRTYREKFTHFAAHCGGLTTLLDRITPDLIETYYEAEGISDTTRWSRFSHCRILIRWCLGKGFMRRNPLEKRNEFDLLAAPKQPVKLPKDTDEEELAVLCGAIQAHYNDTAKFHRREGLLLWLIPLLWFGYYSGLRISELGRLKWGHVDFKLRLLYLYKQKNGEEETVPLSKMALNVLLGMRRGEPGEYVFGPEGTSGERSIESFRRYVARKVAFFRREAGIDRKVTPHSLRHGFCTHLVELNVNLAVIGRAARHKDTATTMRYVHLKGQHVASELDRAYGSVEASGRSSWQ